LITINIGILLITINIGIRTINLLSLGTKIANLARQRRQWETQLRSMPGTHSRARDFDPAFDRLTEVTGFGPNPGALRMFEYVPADPQPALVVVLHGCTQTAASYDFGAGWSTLADRHGFVLLLPEQQRTNNANNCFNWFRAGDIERGQGEAMSIRHMVEKMIVDHGIDRHRVFVTGLSAGGAMTSVMLAAYPDVFAAGAIIAGLPYGTATNVKEAFESMGQVRARSAREWGDLVRAASPHKGPWPRVSVWHGGADPVVKSKNAHEIIKQWTDVHGLNLAPTSTERVDGYPREVWRNPAGKSVIESYTIPTMAHGTPLATGPSDEHVGVPGYFLLDVGISSSYHIAKFWGLTGHPRAVPTRRSEPASIIPAPPRKHRGTMETSGIAGDPVGDAPKLTSPRPSLIDVQAVITDALKAAGLMKS
jgi:poly(hydroxyalkanoate) depolymerase family esterase